MTIKEHDNNIYTKEEQDKITLYLKNIVQRYFEIENNMSQSTVEAIIIQAYTRLKEILNAESKKFIIAVNEKSGAIDFSIKDLDGEPLFDKKTAFNKNFCEDGKEQKDTIVMGNDSRLYDKRKPLDHIHTIDDIDGLRNILDNLNGEADYSHVHNNKDVLDMIRYTGSRVSIDLVLLDDIKSLSEESLKRFTETNEYASNIHQEYANQLVDIIRIVKNRLEYIKSQIDSWISWLDKSKIYSDIEVKRFKVAIYRILEHYLSNKEYDKIKDIFNNCIKNKSTVSTGVDFSNDKFVIQQIDAKEQGSISGEVYFMPFMWKDGITYISSEPIEKSFGNVNNDIINMYLRYIKNNVKHKIKLPYVYKINNNDILIMNYYINSNNELIYRIQRQTLLPALIKHNLMLNVSIGHEQSSDIKELIVSNDDSAQTVQTNLRPVHTDILSVDTNNVIFKATKGIYDQQNNQTEINLDWTVDGDNSYILYRKHEGEEEWESLMSNTVIKSSNTQVLEDIYEASGIHQIKRGSDTYTLVTDPAQKQTSWKVDGNFITSSVNESRYDIMLTLSSFTTYKHTCTLTTSAISNDNGVISVIISAIKTGNKLYTLSLVVSRTQQQGLVSYTNMPPGISLVYNLYQSDEKVITTIQTTNATSDWTPKTKYSLTIKKDMNKLMLFLSDFYEMENAEDYDNNKISRTANYTITMKEIKNQTGKDFGYGMIGYGNISQQFATIVGIDFVSYGSYTDTSYNDKVTNYGLVGINLSGSRTSITKEQNLYKYNYHVKADYSALPDVWQYRLGVCKAANWDNINEETDSLEPYTYSDILSIDISHDDDFTIGVYYGDSAGPMVLALQNDVPTIENVYGNKFNISNITSTQDGLIHHLDFDATLNYFLDKFIFAKTQTLDTDIMSEYNLSKESIDNNTQPYLYPVNASYNVHYDSNGTDIIAFDNSTEQTDENEYDIGYLYSMSYNNIKLNDLFPDAEIIIQQLGK